MKRYRWLLSSSIVLFIALFLGLLLNQSVTTFSQSATLPRTHTFVIDAGHGEPDGGAVSCTGVKESDLNLAIAVRLNDLMHLLGLDTVMVRDSEMSVYTEGNSIAAKKVSDVKHRCSIVNNTQKAVLVSIHQNHFADSRYSGGQVFYAPTNGSQELAKSVQKAIKDALNPDSKRQAKKSDGVYLMQHIECPGILIECGFLSHQEEEYKLNTPEYQKKLAITIGTALSRYYYFETDSLTQ